MEKDSSKKILLSVLGVAILVVAVVGISFAAFSYTRTGETVNKIETGQISMTYTETENGIDITNALPMTDETGKALKAEKQYFDFTVASTISGTTTINYAITATKEADSTLPDTGVKVYLTSGSDKVEELAPTKVSALTKTVAGNTAGAPASEYTLKTGTLNGTSTTTYRLRMWVANDYAENTTTGTENSNAITKQTYKLRVNVYGKANAQ